jgi:hypothetical protein
MIRPPHLCTSASRLIACPRRDAIMALALRAVIALLAICSAGCCCGPCCPRPCYQCPCYVPCQPQCCPQPCYQGCCGSPCFMRCPPQSWPRCYPPPSCGALPASYQQPYYANQGLDGSAVESSAANAVASAKPDGSVDRNVSYRKMQTVGTSPEELAAAITALQNRLDRLRDSKASNSEVCELERDMWIITCGRFGRL